MIFKTISYAPKGLFVANKYKNKRKIESQQFLRAFRRKQKDPHLVQVLTPTQYRYQWKGFPDRIAVEKDRGLPDFSASNNLFRLKVTLRS